MPSLALKDEGRLDEAIAPYEHALALKSDNPIALCNLGGAFGSKGQSDKAIAAYRQAIDLRPQHAETHANLGKTLLRNGPLDDAIEAFRKAIVLCPGSAQLHNGLGSALRDKGRLGEATQSSRFCHRAQFLNFPNSSEPPHALYLFGCMAGHGKRQHDHAASGNGLYQ
jgi:Flp pilus assembly protein TadD